MASKVAMLDEIGDQFAEPGSRPWAIYFVNHTKMVRNQLSSDVERLKSLIDRLQRNEAWKPLGFASFSMLATSRIGLQPDEIDAISKATKGKTIGEVIPPLKPHGGDRRTDQDSKNKSRILVRGGTNVAYRIAKLKRDAPEFAARLEAGEFTNVRAAERAAGLPVPAKLTPLERAYRAVMRLNEADRAKLLGMVANAP